MGDLLSLFQLLGLYQLEGVGDFRQQRGVLRDSLPEDVEFLDRHENLLLEVQNVRLPLLLLDRGVFGGGLAFQFGGLEVGLQLHESSLELGVFLLLEGELTAAIL